MANLVNPVQVALNNIDQQPILFIPDGPQDLLLEVTNLSGQTLTLGSTSFFRMIFRPSTLIRVLPAVPDPTTLPVPLAAQDRGIQLVTSDPKAPAGSDLLAAVNEGPNWKLVTAPGDDGSVTLTLNLNDGVTRTLAPLDPTNARASRLVLRLKNIQPASTGQGSRSTPVDVQFSVRAGALASPTSGPAAAAAVTQTELTGIEKAHLTLLNISRTAYLAEERSSAITSARTVPFGAEFVGSNNAFNDGQPSRLTLRIRNLTDDPLNLAPGLSTIELHFLAGDDPAAQNIGVLTPQRSLVTVESVDVVAPWDWIGLSATATGTSWPIGQEFQINISIGAMNRPSGYAPLAVRFSNLPDHPEGQLELLVQIGPLFIDDEAAVGITRPLRLYGSETNVKAHTVPPPATIGIDATGQLHIEAPHHAKITGAGDSDTVVTIAGKLAAPRLSAGVALGDDTLVLDPPPSPGNLVAQHTLTADKFLTKSGFDLEVPKGTILIWSPPTDVPRTSDENGNALVLQAPDGWEVCDGRPDPTDPSGARMLPDLRGMFIVGQGHYEEADPVPGDDTNLLKLNYSLGSPGGAARVGLADNEVPGHRHLFQDLTTTGAGIQLGEPNAVVLPLVSSRSSLRVATATAASPSVTMGTASVVMTHAGGGPSLGNDFTNEPTLTGGPAVRHENRPPFFVVVYIIKIK